MAGTYEPIATNTLSTSAATVTFSGISGNYTDLVINCSVGNTTSSSSDFLIRFNGDSGSNYSFTRLIGDGYNAFTDRTSSTTSLKGVWSPGTNSNNPTGGQSLIVINNYSNTSTYKCAIIGLDIIGSAATNAYLGKTIGMWRSTAAVTSVTFSMASGSIAANSSFTIYGIKAA